MENHSSSKRQKLMVYKSHRRTNVEETKELPKYPEPEYFQRTPFPRFPSMIYQHIFETFEFHIIDCRYINRQFFQFAVPHIYDRLAYYHLENLVNCASNINIDLCKEFYVNLRPTNLSKTHFVSTVAGRNIEFTPDSIRTFLDLRPSSNPFVCFPEVTEVTGIYGSFAHETIDNIHDYYFNCPRNASTRFDVTKLSADQYVWYRIVIDCILPIMSKGRSMMSISHMTMMFALEVPLDIDIALNIYHSILYHSDPINGKIYMPFCHVITSFLASQDIDTTVGTVKRLSKDYDQLGPCQLNRAGIIYTDGGLQWIKADKQKGAFSEPKESEWDHTVIGNVERLDKFEDQEKKVLVEIGTLREEIKSIAKKQSELYEQQKEMLKIMSILHNTLKTPEWHTTDDEEW